MRAVKRLSVGVAIAALAVTALGAPVTAAETKGTLAIVNGIPGTRVDVCLNGREIRSGLRYGGKVYRDVVATGETVLKVFKRDPRTCRGDRLGQRNFTMDPAEDLTIVATRKAPRIVVFDNLGLGTIPPRWAPWEDPDIVLGAFRSAADFAMHLKRRILAPGDEEPVTHAVEELWTKGDEQKFLHDADHLFVVRATLPGEAASIAGPSRIYLETSHRYEWILVGTRPANVRFVVLDRLTSKSPEG